MKKFQLGALQLPASIDARQSQAPTSMPRAVPMKYSPLTGEERFQHYLKTFGPGSFLRTAAGTGINQARDSVPEWGQGMEGYGRRYASSFGRKIVKRSIQEGLEAMLHDDPRYFHAEQGGIMSRAMYAVGQTFVVHKDNGSTGIAYPRFVAAIAAAFISQQWHPDPDKYHSVGHGFASSASSIGIDAASHVFAEFWPDIRHKIHH